MLEVSVEKAGIVSGVEFTLSPGTVLGIAGKNGSGKTTLLKFIAGVFEGKGRIRWKGKDLKELSFRERMKVVNAVPQNFEPNLFYSVYEVVESSSPVRLRKKDIDEVLEKVGLSGFGGRIFAKLSGGEKVRVLIARLLAIDPDVVLFDEPSAFLDPDVAVAVAEIVGELKDRGKVVIVASHDVLFLLDTCDLFLGLKEGREVFWGGRGDFLRSLQLIYDVPLKVAEVDGELFIKPNYRR
ncbi:iron complex transport system ATP-binding protein [Desulfurobacterium pacificum]|uniref:Iron complex transport system ATP-binding protein n=1 Tax=Desulfurobacterium pacificum TaxID=240166 RepID=A0ABY1NK52_9BACT|nr:ABC transporter ATP-binding protein [Desulfurobacterium pacificum]SMP11798.1 iron complex transport system ATP-binding protein [Desulfurobacterium pacificum]